MSYTQDQLSEQNQVQAEKSLSYFHIKSTKNYQQVQDSYMDDGSMILSI
jgi:hypothetical protein